MDAILAYLFGAASFVPHGYCLLWRPDLVAIHAVSDALIAVAYFAIPGAIFAFLRERKDLAPQHRHVAYLFIAFIVACGITHLGSLVTLWQPYYGLLGLAKAGTAAVSLATAVLLGPLVPKLVALPSRADVDERNRQLAREIAAHEATLVELQRAKAELEERVKERTAELETRQRRMELALRSSGVTLFEHDAALRYTWLFNQPASLAGLAFLGRTDREVLGEEADRKLSIKREALESRQPRRDEVCLERDGKAWWWDVHVEPFTASDGTTAIACAAVEITARKRAERHLQFLLRELSHRSKNLLTVIQAMARRTAAGAGSKEDFLKRFEERVAGLAASHDLLVQENWGGVDLRALIASQLGHLSERVDVEGPDLAIRAEATQHIGMAVHELATNALKYGALSTESGRVALTWALVAQPGRSPRFQMRWRESGGPAVRPPERRGFGHVVTERMISQALAAAVTCSFPPDGVAWSLDAPAEQVVHGAETGFDRSAA